MAYNPYADQAPNTTEWRNSDGQSGSYGAYGPDAASARPAAAAGPGGDVDRAVAMAARYKAALAAGNKLGAMTPEMQYGAKLLEAGYKPGGDGNANARVLNGLSQQGVNMNSVAAQAAPAPAPAGMAQGGMGTGGTGPATPGAGAQVQPRNPNPMGYGADQLNQQQMDLLQKRSAVTAENVNPARPGPGTAQGGMGTGGAGPATPGAGAQVQQASPSMRQRMDDYFNQGAQKIQADIAAGRLPPEAMTSFQESHAQNIRYLDEAEKANGGPMNVDQYQAARQRLHDEDVKRNADPMGSDYGSGMAQGGMGTGGTGPATPGAGAQVGMPKAPMGGTQPGMPKAPMGGTQPGMPKAPPPLTGPMVSPPRGGFGGSTMTRPEITRPAVTRPAVTRPAVTRPAVTRPAVTRPAANPNPMGYGADQLNPQQMALLKR